MRRIGPLELALIFVILLAAGVNAFRIATALPPPTAKASEASR